jgi:hypothetical protein
MVEALATDMHTFEIAYTEPGGLHATPRVEKVEALYWKAGNDAQGDDARFVYFKDWRHRTVLAVKTEYVTSVRMVERAR